MTTEVVAVTTTRLIVCWIAGVVIAAVCLGAWGQSKGKG